MTVVDPTASPLTGALSGVHPSRLTPGEVVRGCLIGRSPNGQTLLQIGPYQVASERPMSGRPGDILLFEVLPSRLANADGDKSKAPLLVRLLETTRAATHATGNKAGVGQAVCSQLPFTGLSATRASSTPIAVENQGSAQGSVFRLMGTMQLVETMRALGRKWIDHARRRLAPGHQREDAAGLIASRSKVDAGAIRSDRTSTGAEKGMGRTTDGLWDCATDFNIGSGRDAGKARISLQAPQGGASRIESGRTLTANLVLEFVHTGSIEVDVQMNADVIRVLFKVDTEDLGHAIRSDIGRMRTALRHLAPEVYCRVTVGEPCNAGDECAHGDVTGKQGIDCTI